jgi:hypothetical protein
MKLSCKVIEDMLPMYYDGVCSDESATLVEGHLKECPQCSRVLADLHSDIDIPKKTVDDLKPLESIQKKWKKCKWAYIRRGVCITLAALLLVTSVLTGIWYFSYAKYYYQMTERMDKTTKEDKFFTSSDYTTEKNGYRFEVWLPIILSDSGFARVMDEDGLVMFLYPEAGGSYSFWVCITDQDNESYSVYLKSDMSPDFENHPFPVRSENEKQKITQLLMDKNEDLFSMLEEVQVFWGIDLLEYAN